MDKVGVGKVPWWVSVQSFFLLKNTVELHFIILRKGRIRSKMPKNTC
jgi:hypothetical protein